MIRGVWIEKTPLLVSVIPTFDPLTPTEPVNTRNSISDPLLFSRSFVHFPSFSIFFLSTEEYFNWAEIVLGILLLWFFLCTSGVCFLLLSWIFHSLEKSWLSIGNAAEPSTNTYKLSRIFHSAHCPVVSSYKRRKGTQSLPIDRVG